LLFVNNILKTPWLRSLLQPFLSQEPTAQLIRQTARQQWRLIAVNLGSSVLQAFSEGATLAVVFLAVEVLSARGDGLNWARSLSRIERAQPLHRRL
jgi:hypothetical protein